MTVYISTNGWAHFLEEWKPEFTPLNTTVRFTCSLSANMAVFKSILAGLALLTASAAAVDDLGPAGFMWPADRVWSAAADNNAPCGSIAGVANRTKFPLSTILLHHEFHFHVLAN